MELNQDLRVKVNGRLRHTQRVGLLAAQSVLSWREDQGKCRCEVTKEFIKQVVPLSSPDVWLRKQQLLLRERPTVSGVVLFADLPQALLPKHLRRNDTITNPVARSLTGIASENAMKSVFYRLRDRELLEQVPELRGNKSAWRLTRKGKQHLADT
ncbi:MAG TPA: hypothetical protein VNU71_22415 [Burkholderiaceae bacterium]|nr:hypothetical protein [Burkholderiaceae bacterium]